MEIQFIIKNLHRLFSIYKKIEYLIYLKRLFFFEYLINANISKRDIKYLEILIAIKICDSVNESE